LPQTSAPARIRTGYQEMTDVIKIAPAAQPDQNIRDRKSDEATR
jgi:hypothetical protein